MHCYRQEFMYITLKGYHGTNKALTGKILNEGLSPSKGDREWLGDGRYFFIEGICRCPDAQARDWAIYRAWDKQNNRNRYLFYAVLRGIIQVDDDKFLDLTTADGVELFEYIQKQCSEKLATIGREVVYVDGYLINFARCELTLDIDVVKGNFYIKIKKEERINNIRRRVPNCTICSVYNPHCVVQLKSVEDGRI